MARFLLTRLLQGLGVMLAVSALVFIGLRLAGDPLPMLVPGAATAMVNYYRANFPGLGRYGNGPRIEVPTLMVWGEEDVAIGIEFTQNYEPFVADLTLERLPGVSHWVQQEAPEAVNERLARWLKLKGLA